MDTLFYFNEDAIRDFLVFKGRDVNSKDYEIVVALATHKFCEKNWNQACEIGFPVTVETQQHCKTNNELDFTMLTNLMRGGRKEDTPVDFAIRSKDDSEKGIYIQTKRFGLGRDVKNSDTNALIRFINELQYQQLEITLLVILETGREINFKKIENSIDWQKFPFQRLLFFLKQENYFCFVSVFPEKGMEKYDLSTFLD